MKIRKVSADAMVQKTAVAASPEQPSARELQRTEIEKGILERLTDASVVLAIDPEGDKPATLRARILRVAKDRGVEVAVQVRHNGEGVRLLVGLLTPERRPTRGRKPKTA